MLLRVDDPDSVGSAYYFDVFSKDDGGAQVIWYMNITEYVVIASLRFRAAGRASAACVACMDPQVGGNVQGVLVLLASSVRHEVNDDDLLETIRGSSFNPVASLIAFCQSSKVDWAWLHQTSL